MNGTVLGPAQSAWQHALAWLAEHESLVLFLAILFEESGVPMPIPADLAMAVAGYRIAQGHMSILEAFLIGQSATLIGSSVLYWVGRRGGRALLFRYGKLLHLDAHRIARLERLVIRLGPLAVIIGRQIPGLRLAAPLASGVFRISYWLFVPAMIVGSTVYIAIFIGLGMWGGPALLRVLRLSGLPLRLVMATVLLIGATFLLGRLSRRAREVVSPAYRQAASRRRSLEAALLAGLGANAIMGLAITWLLAAFGLLGQSTPEVALLRFLEHTTTTVPVFGMARQRLILAAMTVAVPVQAVAHLLWAILYAFVFEPRLRGTAAVRGLKFAAGLWVFSGLVLFPALGAGLFGLGLELGPLPMIGEAVRLTFFGASLGLLYRLVRLARQPRLHTGHRHGHRHQVGALPESAVLRAS